MSFSYDSSYINQDPLYNYPASSFDGTYESNHLETSGYTTGSYAVSNISAGTDIDTIQFWDDSDPINNSDIFTDIQGLENDFSGTTSTAYAGTQTYQSTTDLDFYDTGFDEATQMEPGYQHNNAANGLLNHVWNTQSGITANISSPPESPRGTVQSFNDAAMPHLSSNQQMRPPLNRAGAYNNYYAMEGDQNTYEESSSTFDDSEFQSTTIQKYSCNDQTLLDESQDYSILNPIYYDNYHLVATATLLSPNSRASSTYEPDSPPSGLSIAPMPTETKQSLKRRSRGKPGVSYLCPHEICSRNRNSESQGFDRHDNLLAHLRQVHKETIPRRQAGRPRKVRNGD